MVQDIPREALYRRIRIGVITVVCLVPIIGFIAIRQELMTSYIAQEHILYWVQTVAGSWSRPMNPPRPLTPFWFIISVALAMTLNLGLFGITVKLLKDVIDVKRRQQMRFTDIFRVRDRAVKDAIYDAVLPEFTSEQDRKRFIDNIEEAFNRGASQGVEDIGRIDPETERYLRNRFEQDAAQAQQSGPN
jgi:hypothetical protein